jgi:uncharacterized membrane protein
MGAMIATSMSANVFFWIIPGQRKVVASLKAGEPVDPRHGQRAKQRSVHNTYFTLPVLFAMLSNHYGWLYSHKLNWLVLIGMMFAGAAIRQFFVMRHGYKLGRNSHPWPYAAVGVAALLAVFVWLKPAPVAATAPVRQRLRHPQPRLQLLQPLQLKWRLLHRQPRISRSTRSRWRRRLCQGQCDLPAALRGVPRHGHPAKGCPSDSPKR